MKISIGNDHAGPDYKKAIVKYLESKGIEVINHGTDTTDSVDYPDFVHPVAQDVENGTVDFGIIICGSGNGVAMTANKYKKGPRLNSLVLLISRRILPLFLRQILKCIPIFLSLKINWVKQNRAMLYW